MLKKQTLTVEVAVVGRMVEHLMTEQQQAEEQVLAEQMNIGIVVVECDAFWIR